MSKIEVEVDHCPACSNETLVETGSAWSCLTCGYIGPLCAEIHDNGESQHPCFRPGDPSNRGDCHSDGWFRCAECEELASEVRKYREED